MKRVLLVDNDERVRSSLGKILEVHDFEVIQAATVSEALKLISTSRYDVLLSDLHMPGAGDGLTLVSAMRHSNPEAVTLLLSGFPDVEAAANAIVMQTDEILVKPIGVATLIDVITQRLATPSARQPAAVESVATVIERSATTTIRAWIKQVELDQKVMAVAMTSELRCAHLPELFREVVARLRHPTPLGANEPNVSQAAIRHGAARRKQGYSAAMMVEESRMLQVSIFQTLQDNLARIDFSVLLIGVMTIADEVDAQLSAAMESYKIELIIDPLAA